jgi:hypothetical protein
MLCFEQDPGWVNIIDFAKRGRPFVRLINATLSDPWKETAAFRQPVGG